ncbi:UxaA family hydrolase [Thermanaerosceptrum fracticalcis]|nr:UxaA family hydrolase [Thermanaerosceptrum fracticalcis]
MESEQRGMVVVIDFLDNVATAVEDLKAGEEIRVCIAGRDTLLRIAQDVPFGHKVAIAPIPKGREVIKYGEPIGTSVTDIKLGEHVHVHNMVSNRGRGDLQMGVQEEQL